MKQPQQNVPVRSSPTFQPGVGFQLTPSATAATAPYTSSTATNTPTLIAVDPFEQGTDSTGITISDTATTGTLYTSNVFSIPLNLPQMIVPTGVYACLFPWYTIGSQTAGNPESHNAFLLTFGAVVLPEAYYGGAWQSGYKIPPGIEVTSWQLLVSSIYMYLDTNTLTANTTLNSKAFGGAMLLTYPT